LTIRSETKRGSTKPRPRLRKGEGEQLRREILDATRDLLAERGNLDLVSIRDIAGRVGVSSPSIYLHFEDKDHLSYAVCREAFESFGARLLPVLAAEGNALERLRLLGTEYVRWDSTMPLSIRCCSSARLQNRSSWKKWQEIPDCWCWKGWSPWFGRGLRKG